MSFGWSLHQDCGPQRVFKLYTNCSEKKQLAGIMPVIKLLALTCSLTLAELLWEQLYAMVH